MPCRCGVAVFGWFMALVRRDSSPTAGATAAQAWLSGRSNETVEVQGEWCGKITLKRFPCSNQTSPNSTTLAANSSGRETYTVGLLTGDRLCGSFSISLPSHRLAHWGWLLTCCLKRQTKIRMPDGDMAAAAGDPDTRYRNCEIVLTSSSILPGGTP